MQPDEARARLRALGFSDPDVELLYEHFADAEAHGKSGHGWSRIPFLERLAGYDPQASPATQVDEEAYWRWDAAGTIGYLTVRKAVDAAVARPPRHARLVVLSNCFPTGMLGHYVRRLAEAGLVGVVTATSPPRLGHPAGGPKLAGTNPLAIGIPSSDGRPLVSDVSMGRVTYGDVLAGDASEEDLVPFGGEHAHKAFALAVALQLLVDSFVDPGGYGAVMLVARPHTDPLPAFRQRAEDVRLPGDS